LLSIVPPRPVRVAHAAAAPIQARGLSAPKLSNNILQKELAFIGHWSGTVVESGRYKRPGILPRRLVGRGGVSVVRRNGAINRMALAEGFAWSGKTYPSLSKIASSITGTRWNGPKFFGLRDKPSKGAGS
jgi:hypothetical protein